MIDERTELLINRRIDGELADEEILELNKLLIRSPEARALLEVYDCHDTAAAQALARLCYPSSGNQNTIQGINSRGWRSRLGVGIRAVAAALLLMTMAGVPSYWNKLSHPSNSLNTQTPQEAGLMPAPQPSDMPLLEGPREETQQLQRNVVGVWDEETQSVYILEMDQSAQKVVPFSANF